jgi:hypothetical protein
MEEWAAQQERHEAARKAQVKRHLQPRCPCVTATGKLQPHDTEAVSMDCQMMCSIRLATCWCTQLAQAPQHCFEQSSTKRNATGRDTPGAHIHSVLH